MRNGSGKVGERYHRAILVSKSMRALAESLDPALARMATKASNCIIP